MECRFRDLKIEFPLELLQILDLGMEMSFGEHPSYWVKAVIPDEKADSYVSSITENSELKVSIVKKDSIKVIFCGYTTSVEVCSKAGYYVATIRAIAYTAKMDIEKKSRSFFKKGVTYHQILEEVIKDYPNTQMKEMVQTKRVTDFPILQYQETDWEFIKRIASMYEVVVTPVCTESFPRFYIGKPESVKTKFLDKQATETFRDLGTCYQDYFKEMQSFSIPKLDAQKKLQEEMEKQAKELERKLEELSKNEESKGMVAAEDQTGVEAFLQMLSALFLSKGSDGEEMIVSAMDSSMEEDQAALTPMDSMEALGGMSGTVDTIGEMNFTFFSFESRKFYPLGSMVTLPNDMTLMVTHVECYVYKEEVFYEYIVREASGVTAIYEHNRRLAGVSLLGTIKKRVGNTVSINLDIDQDDGYKSAQEDYFFAYALETKDYYCMPVEGARVHLYFPTGMEWEAIAIHSMRMEKDHSSKRAAKIQNPDNNSLSNDFGVSLDLTPNHINFTPHDANSVFIKLEKNGDITIEGQDITISAKNINLGKAAPSSIVDDGGSEVTCKNLSLTASKVLYATRCTGGEEPAPIEDHFVGLNEYAQLYSTEKIKHITTGAPKAPSVSYDESDLRTKEAEQIKEQNESVEKALIDRKNAGIAQLGRGLFIAAVGVAIVAATVLTGGAALAPLVAVVGNTAAGVIGGVIGTGMAVYGSSQMQEGLSNINLADSGDFSTPADNYLKEKMGEPLYSIMGNGFVIAGSIITGGALGVSAGSILFVGGVTTGVSMVFDYCDNGRLDMGPLDYLNSFSTTCLITSLTGPLAKKFGNCNTFKGRFAGRFVQQMSASTLYALTSGQLDLMHMGENMVRELLSSLVAAAIPVQGPWAEQMGNKLKYITGAVDMTMDGILDSAAQIFENKMSGDPNAKFDYKRLAQTLIISAIFNFKFSADPVNCARGNLYCFREELSYEDLYGEFTFKRRYDSMLDYQGTMGMGWLHEYDSMLIVEESKNTIHIVMPDGHKETFIRQQDQSWLNQNSKTRVYELIEGREECCFELVSRENGEYRRYRYEYDGRLTQISYDPYALRKTHITYRSEQELSTANTNARRKYPEIETITSPGGRVLRFHYKNGALTSVTDDSGRCVRYEYENGCLVKAYYPSGGIQTYIYDENRRLVTMSGEDGRDFITNQYDAKGRVVRQHYPDGNFCKIEYDDVKRISTFTFSDTGRIERYYYNKMLQIEKTEYLSGPSLQEEIVENSDKNIRKTIYGRGSRPEVSVAKEEAQVILDAVETCTYDDMGNKIEETDRNGNTIYRTYDAFGNVLEERLPNGLVRCKKYDNLYHLVHEWDNAGAEKVYEYDSQGNQTAIIEKLSQGKVAVTHFSYDEYKRVITKTDPNGNVTKYAYDGFSTKNPSYVFTPSGEQFSYQYDSAGRRSSVTTTYGTAKFEYSETGVLTRTTDALGNTTRRYVDAAGNVLKLIPPNLYSGKYQQVQGYAYEYDYLDRLVKTIYPDGTVEAQNVDMDGNVVKVIHPNGYDENTNDGYGVTYEYDSCQYKVKETTAEGYTTRYKYDANGNVIKMIQPEDYDPVTDDGKGIQYEYDLGNRLTAILDENGVYVRKLVYDLAGRLVKDINGEGYAYGSTDEERYGILYSYNALGW
ncbi:MAG: hypothetical protein IKL07_09600, partial [Clostridium sp.]|nr:hypothetical protein [Clostridium sp.]